METESPLPPKTTVSSQYGFTRSMMPFNIFALDTCDFFNIDNDIFEILQVWKYKGNFYEKKFISDD